MPEGRRDCNDIMVKRPGFDASQGTMTGGEEEEEEEEEEESDEGEEGSRGRR